MAIRDDPRADTNVLHFRILKPLLRERLEISAVRIDELHHNENIDIRLLREIDRSELVIADLTYERPSVYFEAGYALGQNIPVVYTCRADHLGRQSPYQVHFDLRQRNIVPWREPSDRQFTRLLVARIRNTMAAKLRIRRSEAHENREEEAFQRLSAETRSELLVSEATAFLRRYRLRIERPEYPRLQASPRGYRLRGSVLEKASAHVFSTITQRRLEYLHHGDLYPDPDLPGIRSRVDHKILVSEGSVTRRRVEGVFREYAMAADKTWVLEATHDGEGRRRRLFLHIVDGVRSAPMLRRRLAVLGPQIFPRGPKRSSLPPP
jgi:nucleoside 2-deoxyribosyltransferase